MKPRFPKMTNDNWPLTIDKEPRKLSMVNGQLSFVRCSRGPGSPEQGMVLVSVMWVILILSLVSFSLAAAVRVEVASTQQSFDSDRAYFMAKGAAEVVFDRYSQDQPVPLGADSPIRQEINGYVFPFDSGEAHVRFESESGLIDINKASDKELASLFDSLGIEQDLRNHLVDSILDWRDADDVPRLFGAEINDYPQNVLGKPALYPRNADFPNVEELLRVKNMTPEIFYGSFVAGAANGTYRRIPGLRELITVRSGSDKVNINLAPAEVLAALPAMTPQLADQVIAERTVKPFANVGDLTDRVRQMLDSDALIYLTFDAPQPTALVSQATIYSSGVSKTVRLLFKREQKTQVLTYSPYIYKFVTQITPDRWRID